MKGSRQEMEPVLWSTSRTLCHHPAKEEESCKTDLFLTIATGCGNKARGRAPGSGIPEVTPGSGWSSGDAHVATAQRTQSRYTDPLTLCQTLGLSLGSLEVNFDVWQQESYGLLPGSRICCSRWLAVRSPYISKDAQSPLRRPKPPVAGGCRLAQPHRPLTARAQEGHPPLPRRTMLSKPLMHTPLNSANLV